MESSKPTTKTAHGGPAVAENAEAAAGHHDPRHLALHDPGGPHVGVGGE